MMGARTPFRAAGGQASASGERPQASRRARMRRRAAKAAIYVAAVLLMFLLYGDPNLTFFGWKPNLMLALAGCALLFEGPCMTVGLAVSAGMLTDLLRQTPFGVNGLVIGLVTFLLWSAAKLWLRPVLLNAFFASLILSAAAHVLDYLLVYGAGSGLFVSLYLGDLLSTAAFALLLYWPVRAVYKKLRYTL